MNASSPPSNPPKPRQLGRGLSALLGGDAPPAPQDAAQPPVRGAATAPVEYLRPSRVQPRHSFVPEEIQSLADSIRERGILQPILVRPDPERPNRFEIVAGERRWRAAQMAQLHEVPIVVRELSDEGSLEIALIENVQRSDLNAVDEAQGYKRLIDDYGHTQETIATIIGKSRVHIANTMRLLSLPGEVQDMVVKGQLTAGHARVLLGDPGAEQLARWIVKRGMSVRQAEQMVAKRNRDSAQGRPAASLAGVAPRGSGKDPDTLALEDTLSGELGLRVMIDFDPQSGAGKLTVEYKTLEQLDEVIRRLRRAGTVHSRDAH